jgi:hypothetical protein
VSLSVPFVWLLGARSPRQSRRLGHPLALATSSVTVPSATTRVDIGRGQHAQQGGATTGPARAHATADSGNGPSPLKPIMHRCDFLGFRLVHRTLPPRGETRPKQQVHAPPFPWAERNPNSPQHSRPGICDCHDPLDRSLVIHSSGSNREEPNLSVRPLRDCTPSPAIRTIAGSLCTIATRSHYVIG